MFFKDLDAKQSHPKAIPSYFNSISFSANLKQKAVEQNRGGSYKARR